MADRQGAAQSPHANSRRCAPRFESPRFESPRLDRAREPRALCENTPPLQTALDDSTAKNTATIAQRGPTVAVSPSPHPLAARTHTCAQNPLAVGRAASTSVAVARHSARSPAAMTPRARSSASASEAPLVSSDPSVLATGRQLSVMSMGTIVKDLNDKLAAATSANAALQRRVSEAEIEAADRLAMASDLAAARTTISALERDLTAARSDLAILRTEVRASKYAARRHSTVAGTLRPVTDDDAHTSANPANPRMSQSAVSTDSMSPRRRDRPSSELLALLRKNRDLEVELEALRREHARVKLRARRLPARPRPVAVDDDAEAQLLCAPSDLRVDDLDRDLRAALESAIPRHHLGMNSLAAHTSRKYAESEGEAYRHRLYSRRRPLSRTWVESEQRGAELMERIACNEASDPGSESDIFAEESDDDANDDEDADVDNQDISDMSELEADERDAHDVQATQFAPNKQPTEGHRIADISPHGGASASARAPDASVRDMRRQLEEERTLRGQRDARVAQLLRILDDRTMAENSRATAALRSREAIEVKLASVERALAAERAGRQAAEREAAALITKATRQANQVTVAGNASSSPMLADTTPPSTGVATVPTVVGRRRRKPHGFFPWNMQDSNNPDDPVSKEVDAHL